MVNKLAHLRAQLVFLHQHLDQKSRVCLHEALQAAGEEVRQG